MEQNFIVVEENISVVGENFIIAGESIIVFGKNFSVLGEDFIVVGENYLAHELREWIRKKMSHGLARTTRTNTDFLFSSFIILYKDISTYGRLHVTAINTDCFFFSSSLPRFFASIFSPLCLCGNFHGNRLIVRQPGQKFFYRKKFNRHSKESTKYAQTGLTKCNGYSILMVVMEVAVHEITFQTMLLNDGHLYCPKEYASPKATFNVIVSFPDAENVAEPLRPFGLCKGEFRVPDDFDAPLPEYILREFEGQ
ncbi:MAG: hypothetical protein QG657_1743 [Acidobacteriota bacterium]|nr:hypothetical protein [Acidobacteriota bacterium]